ncbi:hypothetical protein [Actinoalloteichus caeruleus]|uniref:hypothetical protein n=1 Tax=Actinoalloteichus cyanogriseus TaxID=2893586 RepID=UPI003BB88668
MNRLAALWWPLPPVVLVSSAALVAASLVLSTRWLWDQRFQEWVVTSFEAHEQVLWAAVLAAVVSCWAATRLTPTRMLFGGAHHPRTGWPVVRRHLAVLNGWFLLGYVVGIAPALVLTATRAQYGGPDVLAILSGPLGIAAASALGYLFGVVVPVALLSPVPGLGVYLLYSQSAVADGWTALLPLVRVWISLGRSENPAVTGYRVIFLLALLAACAVTSAVLLRATRRTAPRALVAVLGCLALPGLLAVVPFVRTPAPLVHDAERPRVCAERGGTEYCVHEGHASELDVLGAAGETALARLGDSVPAPRRVWDLALAGRGEDPGVVWVQLDPVLPLEPEVASTLAASIAGDDACRQRYGDPGPEEDWPEAVALADDLRWRVAALVHEEHAGWAGPFSELSDAELVRWLAEHQHTVASCELGQEDLP